MKLEKMTTAQLKDYLASQNLSTTGNKADLLQRARDARVTEKLSSPLTTPDTPLVSMIDPDLTEMTSVGDNTSQLQDDDGEQYDVDATVKYQKLLPQGGNCNYDSDRPEASNAGEYDAKRSALDQWLKIEEMQDALEDDEWMLKRDLEERELCELRERRQRERIEHDKRQEFAKRRRELKHRYEMHVIDCQQAGLPKPEVLHDSVEKLVNQRCQAMP